MSFQAAPQSRTDDSPIADPTLRVPWYVKAFASGLYTGFSPVATGTAGSILALAIYMVPGFEHPFVIMPACALALLLGAKAAGIMEKRYGHDPAEVTIDEVLGMWISLFLVPKSLEAALIAFLVFRILDVLKPWPAKKFDTLKGGTGIMMDDVVVAVYTNLIVHVIVRLGLHTLLPLP